MNFQRFVILYIVLLVFNGCNKKEGCNCDFKDEFSCERERNCEWVYKWNVQGSTQYVTYKLESQCQCKDKTVYENLIEKKFTLSTDPASKATIGSVIDNEFSLALVKTKNGSEPILISSAGRYLIGLDNESSVYTYFDKIDPNSNLFYYTQTNNKSLRNLAIDKDLNKLGYIIDGTYERTFISSNGIKGILKVEQITDDGDHKIVEFSVKYYVSKETFEGPEDKGFQKIVKNITVSSTPSYFSFYNLTTQANTSQGAELSFATILGTSGTYWDSQFILVSPTHRQNYSSILENGDVTTSFEPTNLEFETIFNEESTNISSLSNKEVLNFNLNKVFFFKSSNGKRGVVRINKIQKEDEYTHEVNFDVKYANE